MKQIKSFKMFPNSNEKSIEAAKMLKKKLLDNGFVESNDFDLAIAVGGDGAFLRMVKNTNFNQNCYYVGINTGTLGFASEVSVLQFDVFVSNIKNNCYKVDKIGVQKTIVVTDLEEDVFYSLNEIVIRELDLNTVALSLYIDDIYLEEYYGDGILISTSFGSTAYNLSFGGSIIYNTFHTLQITPIAPLNNKAYRSLLNSLVLPEQKEIKVVPISKNILISVDGVNKKYYNVKCLKTSVKEKRIQCIRDLTYDFASKVNDKFLK